jgi:hypothetical protein
MFFSIFKRKIQIEVGQVWYDSRPDHLRELKHMSRHCDWEIVETGDKVVHVRSLPPEDEVHEWWQKRWLLKHFERRV